MADDVLYQRGDWIRFYRGGQFVIGQVEYHRVDTLGYRIYQTDAGEVREGFVLEWREDPSHAR